MVGRRGRVKKGELSHFSKRSDASEKSFISLNIKMLKVAKTVLHTSPN